MAGKGGPKSKYRVEFCEGLVEHMSQGLSFSSFGGVIGVGETSLHQWAKDHPEFADAKARAELKSLLWWEKAGLAGMVNKVEGFKPAIWIFSMKARFVKYGYRDNHELEDPDVESARLTPSERLLKIVKSGNTKA